ncbi:hypothetical protein MHYP_G00262690 [Metynnis hypsauchen]
MEVALDTIKQFFHAGTTDALIKTFITTQHTQVHNGMGIRITPKETVRPDRGSGVEQPIGEAMIQVDMAPPAANTEQKLTVKAVSSSLCCSLLDSVGVFVSDDVTPTRMSGHQC